jgi:hypothetical protein
MLNSTIHEGEYHAIWFLGDLAEDGIFLPQVWQRARLGK